VSGYLQCLVAGTAAWPLLLICKDATLLQAAFGYNLALLAERDAELARCDAEAAAAAAAAAVAQQHALELQAALAQAQAGANSVFILYCFCGPEPPLKTCFHFTLIETDTYAKEEVAGKVI